LAPAAEVDGRAELIEDDRFNTPQNRFKHQPEIDAMIEQWTLQYDKKTLMEMLGKAGIRAVRCSTARSCAMTLICASAACS
jgi:crotonobetainyl-CoA:carnitine CoA-transferase CaiB-like acyl-CoA transferase